MGSKNIQVELTVDEIISLSAAILLAKQSAFGYDLDPTAVEMVNRNNDSLISVGIKLSNILRKLQMGDVET